VRLFIILLLFYLILCDVRSEECYSDFSSATHFQVVLTTSKFVQANQS
jgi:hypothetical protein